MCNYEKVKKIYPLHSFSAAFAHVEMQKEADIMNEDITKGIIAQSLLDLLTENSFEDIVVKDIIAHCGIARSTFYRYFPDKYGVVAWFYFRKILSPIRLKTEFADFFSSFVAEIENNKLFFIRCLNKLEQNSLLEVIHTHALNTLCLRIAERNKLEELSTTQLIQAKSFVAGCEYVLFEWMNAGFVESAEEIAAGLLATLPADWKLTDPS